MNSKTRGILLSVFIVLFAAASVFAITADDLSVVVDDTITPPTVEGYNYMQRVYVDTSSLEDGQTVGTVSWEIYPVYDWLTWRPGSDDKNVIIEGILPKYVENQDPYVLHVIARVSGDIASTDAEGNPVSDSEGNDVYISGDISADVDGSGLEIAVEAADETTIGLLADMVSVDVSGAAHGIDKPGKDYSIIINFPTTTAVTYVEDTDDDGNVTGTHTESTDVFVNAQLEYTDPDPEDPSTPVISTENLNLPSWLAYEVLETQYNGAYEYEQDDDGNNILSSGKIVYDDSTKYVKSLRIFYSADTEPANETAGVVRILVTPADTTFSDADDAKSFADSYPNGATIGWSMNYYGIPSMKLSGDFSPNPLKVYAGNKAETEITFTDVMPKSGDFWYMSPDISANVSFDVSWTVANESASNDSSVEGKFTVKATPRNVENKDYTTTFYFTDSNDNVVSTGLTVNVTIPVITISSDNPVVHMSKPPFEEDWPDTHTQWYYAKPISIDLSMIPSGLSVDCVSWDETNETDTVKHGRFIFVYTPMTTTGWSGTIKVYDEYGGSADIAMSLDVEAEHVNEPMTTSVTVSGDSSSSPTFYAGENATVTLNADNAYGKVTWGISNLADLTALGIELSKDYETRRSAAYTFKLPITLPAGTYTANITATDSLDRTAAVYNLTITAKAAPITLSGDLASIDVVYPASGEATVEYYYSPFVSWSMSPDISADVSLDVTSTPANSANSATVQGVISVVATPLTASADTYTTTLTFTDENGNTDSREITINVTLPDFAVKASAASLSLIEGNSEDVTFTASGNAGLVTWTLGEIQDGITVTSSDIANATAYGSIMSYVVTANTAGSYSFDVTAKDAAGRNASATVNVTVTASGDFAVTTESSSLNVDVNVPKNISFTAVNNSGDVTWKLGNVPSGMRVAAATGIDYATENNTLMIYTVTGLVPGASGTITVTATDAAGNTASSTVTITVASKHTPVTFAVTPSAPSVTVGIGASQNVSLTASNNSGLVTWTLGTVPSGVTVAPAEGTSYATREMTTMVYTVTGVTPGSYSVPVTATDSAGNTASATISVTVTTTTLTITPAAPSVTVGVGITQNVAFTASGNSGVVTWAADTSSTAFTIAPASSAYATQDNTRAAFAITGVTAGGSGTVTITAKDSAGNSATAKISVTVNDEGGGGGKIDTPTVDITDATVQSTIKQSLFAKLGSKITSSTEIAYLPSSATSGTVSYVGTNTVYIPTIVVETAKIYVFGVSLENLTAGSLMTWTPHVSSSSTGEYIEASDDEENATFLDDSGNVVTRVPANKHVNIAAYFEPGKIYEPSITTTSSTPEIIGVGSSSGGCSAGLGALVSALAAAFFISKKRS